MTGWRRTKPDFRNRRSMANIAVLYPQSTIAFYQSNGTHERRLNGERIDPTDYLQGLYYALLEGRFLFDFIHQENLTPEALKPYKALLVPNAAYLRDSECQALRRYVASGGSLLATFETSLYNEWGVRREDFGLSDLFGVHVAGDLVGPVGNSYMHLDRPHPIVDVFKDTEILPGTEFRVPVSHLKPESTFLSLIPHYPAYPPEMVLSAHSENAGTRGCVPPGVSRFRQRRLFPRRRCPHGVEIRQSGPEPSDRQFHQLADEESASPRDG